MSQESPIDDLVATLIGAVVFSAIIAGIALAHNSSPTTPAASAKAALRTATSSMSLVVQPVLSATPPLPSPTSSATPTPQSTVTPAASPTPSTMPTTVAAATEDHYWFERPIAAGGTNVVSRFYTYGSTYRGRYQVHHGVEFENPTGTPVVAAGPGRVVVAGPDNPQVYGLFPGFYGRLIVIQHDRTWHGEPVLTLYGHLSTIRVEVGQSVEAGQVIGEVGATGIALGPHLHMEVRVGENAYDATRNPELWLQPFRGYGTIAGRLLDADGNYVSGALISLYDDQDTWRQETETYGEGADPDDGWQENFVFGDVPAGHYTVQYIAGDNAVEETIAVEAGKTVLVTLQALP